MAGDLDQQLDWNNLYGFCQDWFANAQLIRPDRDYTAHSISVLLCRLEETRRGFARIELEKVTDTSLPGEVLAIVAFYSDEAGPQNSPQWVRRAIPATEIKAMAQYRIVVHTTPGWESQDPQTKEWHADEQAAALLWAIWSDSDKFPRGEMQYGYNLRDKTGSWKTVASADCSFIIGSEVVLGNELTIHVVPEGAGTVQVSPQKVEYSPEDIVTLNATPASGYQFVSWSGDASGTDPTISILMDSAKTVIANFQSTGLPDIPIVGDIIAWLEAKLKALWDWLTAQFDWLVEAIKNAFLAILNTVLAPINIAIDWIKQKVLDFWTWITEIIPNALEWVKNKVMDIWAWISTTIPNTLSWIKSQIDSLVTTVANIPSAVIAAADNIIRSFTRLLSSFFDPVCEGFNTIFKSLRPDLELALVYNSPDVKAMVISWWPTGTPIIDFVKTAIRYVLYVPKLIGDIISVAISAFNTDSMGPAFDKLSGDVVKVADNTEALKDYINLNVATPILDGFKDLWAKLADIIKAAFDAIWGALKEFFTVILPGWFRTLWDALHTAVSWIWDKVSGVASFFWDEILKLVHIHSPITPEGGLGTLQGVIKVSLALVGGLGLMTLAGNLVHPIHSLGLEHISAMIYDLTNYRLLTGAAMGVIAAASIRTPLTFYFNSLLRPNLPSERDVAEMYNRELISGDLYSQFLSYRGYPNLWHEPLKRLTETPLRYFGLAAIARSGYFDRKFFEDDLIRGGYAPDSRKVLLTMFQSLSSESVKGMMSATAVKRYKEGMSTDEQFYSELTLLGYSTQQLPRYLAAAKLEFAYDYIADLISAYRDAVRKGNISLDEYRQSLLTLGIVPDKVEVYVLKERARLKPTEKLTPLSPAKPTYETDSGKIKVDTIRRQRRKEIITRDQEVAGLQMLGMPVDYATAIADNDDARLAEKTASE